MTGRHDRSSAFLAAASSDTTSDVLSDVLQTIRLTGALFFPFEASSPWADEIVAAPKLAASILPDAQHVVSYHIVSQGSCWITLGSDPPVRLGTGDIVVIPHGAAYVMSSAPGVRPELSADAVLTFFRQMAMGSASPLVTHAGGGNERAEMICGFLGCDLRPFNPVLEALPALVHVRRPSEVSSHDRLDPLIAFAVAESRQLRAGAKSVLLRLSEVLFIEVIRRYLDSLARDRTGWLAGLRDPIVGHALALLHENPATPWTLERLAADLGVSRSALANRFTDVVGTPPIRYLARWRMQLASRLLSDGSAKVSAVALEVGYQSEAAFSRAFKEVAGMSPAEWRRTRNAGAGHGANG